MNNLIKQCKYWYKDVYYNGLGNVIDRHLLWFALGWTKITWGMHTPDDSG